MTVQAEQARRLTGTLMAAVLRRSVLKEQNGRMPPLPTFSWSKEDIEMDNSSIITASEWQAQNLQLTGFLQPRRLCVQTASSGSLLLLPGDHCFTQTGVLPPPPVLPFPQQPRRPAHPTVHELNSKS